MNDQNPGQAGLNSQDTQSGTFTPAFGRARYQSPQSRPVQPTQDTDIGDEQSAQQIPYNQPLDQSTYSARPDNNSETDPMASDQEQPQEEQFDPGYPDSEEEYAQEQAGQYNLPEYLKPEVEEVVYQWNAFSRPYRKHNRRFFTTIVTIAALVTLIMFFSGQWQLAGVILAMGFLGYMMMVTPPHEVTYQITTFGLRVDSQLFYWEQITRFWFSTKYNTRVLNIDITEFPFRVQLVIGGEATEEALRHILSVVLIEQTPLPTTYDKVTKWWQDKIPLDFES